VSGREATVQDLEGERELDAGMSAAEEDPEQEPDAGVLGAEADLDAEPEQGHPDPEREPDAGVLGAEADLDAEPEQEHPGAGTADPLEERERAGVADPEEEHESAAATEPASPAAEHDLRSLARVVEALLFLSSEPVSLADLAQAAQAGEQEIAQAILILEEQLEPGCRGLQLRELGGGYLLASAPEAEDAARRLFSRPRVATLTPAQTETLAIVAYLQPISRPEIGRIRGVSADSAAAALLERGLIEEAGRSQFGAALYRTTTMFLKLFGLGGLEELPKVAQWDPSPEEQAELRDRLLRAGEARAGGGPTGEA
jgi:segregation and condensation protein B